MTKQIRLAGLVLGTLAMTPASAFTLADAGFESAILVDDGNGTGKWNPFSDGSLGNSFSVSAIDPRSGNDSLRLELANANGFAGLFQDVPVISGEVIIWSGWHSLQSGNAGGTEIRIEYRDSVSNTEIARTANQTPVISGVAYEQFSLSDTVPAGADTARVVYAIQSFGAAAPQVIHVDDVEVSGAAVVPEPVGSIFALSGLFVWALRRRRS